VMVVVVAGTLFFGFVISRAGYSLLREWPSISLPYATCGGLGILVRPGNAGGRVMGPHIARPAPDCAALRQFWPGPDVSWES
jgi:hypothetical protein